MRPSPQCGYPMSTPSPRRSVDAGRRPLHRLRPIQADIAAGKGRGPKPFVLAGKAAADPGAVWDSRTADNRASTAPVKARKKSTAKLPDFVAPELCPSVERPPNGSGWVHKIKFDGYRTQMRTAKGEVTLRTRLGLDWTAKFDAIASAATARPLDGIIDGEIVALDDHGVPDFAALQAAPSEGKTDNLVFYPFDLLFGDDEDVRRRRLSARKERLEGMVSGLRGDAVTRFVPHFFETAATLCCAPPADCRWKPSHRRSSMRRISPAAAEHGQRRGAGRDMRSSSADG
jgi:ATP dependent DNA ligase domain